MQRISPFLWFDSQAEEAAELYVSLFPNSQIVSVSRAPEGGPVPGGSVMGVSFVLDGLEVQAINGGPAFAFTEAISLYANAETQDEIDRLWAGLLEGGGQESQCGWLKDRFGLSWQIVPPALPKLLADPDPARAQRVMQAMLGMTKLDIAALESA